MNNTATQPNNYGYCTACNDFGYPAGSKCSCGKGEFWRPPVDFYFPEGENPLPWPTDKNDEHGQGWSNFATCYFDILFMQEQDLYSKMADLIREDGAIDYREASKLMQNAYENGGMMPLQPYFPKAGSLPRHCVNVQEICDEFCERYKE